MDISSQNNCDSTILPMDSLVLFCPQLEDVINSLGNCFLFIPFDLAHKVDGINLTAHSFPDELQMWENVGVKIDRTVVVNRWPRIYADKFSWWCASGQWATAVADRGSRAAWIDRAKHICENAITFCPISYQSVCPFQSYWSNVRWKFLWLQIHS